MNKYPLISILLIALLLSTCNTTPKVWEEPFEPSLKSPSVPIGEIEVQFNRVFPLPGIKKIAPKVFYFPVEDAVCLQWRVDFLTYHQFWSHDGRELFLSALNQYKEDFETRSFGRNSRRAKRQYGVANGYIYWQTHSIAVQAKAGTNVELGYIFVDRMPYFTANQRQAEYIDPMSLENHRELPEMPIYFTRAQADALAELFDPEFLAGIVLTTPSRVMEVEFDDY